MTDRPACERRAATASGEPLWNTGRQVGRRTFGDLPTVGLPAGGDDSAITPKATSGHGQLGERPGDRIGPYKLLEVIGEGGFGVVFVAERREPMVQRVALKIIKPGIDSKAVIARFEQERQAVAVMERPNVAKVIDGGVTANGRPYFVMEHVKGEPITAFADRHRLTMKQRLELFVPVCDAVQHAHIKGSSIAISSPATSSWRTRPRGTHTS